MKDWIFSGEEYVCDLRVAGVLVRDGLLLMQRDRGGNEYALPGGHVKIGEVMTDSLVREFMEETGAKIECRNLLWTEECFWEYRGKKVHNIAFYYRIELCSGSDIADRGEFVASRDNSDVLLGWTPIEKIGQMTIYPEFIKQRIHRLNQPTAHFVTTA